MSATDAADLQLRPRKQHGTELPINTTAVPSKEKLGDALEDIERDAIVRALEQTRYNKTKAAALLGMTFRSLDTASRSLGSSELTIFVTVRSGAQNTRASFAFDTLVLLTPKPPGISESTV